MAEERREICECKNCGNEAEMIITCTLPDEEPEQAEAAAPAEKKTEASEPVKKKQKITCTHCGNEAEMWLDE